MKITTSKIDKGSTLAICIIGIVVMIGSAAFYIFASERDKITRICVYAAISIGLISIQKSLPRELIGARIKPTSKLKEDEDTLVIRIGKSCS